MKKFLISSGLVIIIAALVATNIYLLRNARTFQSNTIVVSTHQPKQKGQINPLASDLSLDKIFSPQDLSKFDSSKIVTIEMTGDIIPARYTNYKIVKLGNFNFPYLKTADWLRAAELTLANLETPLMNGCSPTTEGMSFCGDPRNIRGLAFAGIDLVSLANNHSGNRGQAGLSETESGLRAARIDSIENGGTVYRSIKGVKFAFLACNGVGQPLNPSQLESDIKMAHTNGAVVVVLPHWGKEYVRKPEAAPGVAPDDPKTAAHAMIDAGADLILGNHPHWYQGIEIYKNKLVVYAHGNFLFDQAWSTETTQGVVGKYSFYNGKLIAASFRPIQIADYSQPYFLEGAAADDILKTMKANSWED